MEKERFGKLLGFKTEKNQVIFDFENIKGIIEVITPSIINIFAPIKREERLSRAIENLQIQQCSFTVIKNEKQVMISTDALTVSVSEDFKVDFYDKEGSVLCEDYRGKRDPFVRRGNNIVEIAEAEGHKVSKNTESQKVEVLKKMVGDEYFYGFGEKTGHLNKKGYHYQMWNTDNPEPHVESFEVLYKSIPFFITLREKKAYGIFFDNTFRSHFDMGKENNEYFYFGAEDGNLDYYFIKGPSVAEVLKGYTYLTGTTPLPQLWTLGYQQCRWSYPTEERIWEIAEQFRERDIPCDTLYLDIDYMDGYRVFTWDQEKFPNFVEMMEELKERGFKVVTIIDPGVKKDKGYAIYDEGIENHYFATDKDGITYVNEVWPGESVFPDFSDSSVRAWWSENQKIMMDAGVAGIWNDMNEPASFNGPLPDDVQFKNDGFPTDHREIHNVYGQLMSKAANEGIKKYSGKRPFVITRACYAGIQKHSTVWTGDNQSLWEHLRMSVPMLMNLGLSGVAFCGTDVGGFGFDCTAELLSRWVQVGCFTPLFRNHTAANTRDQEPWAFDQQTEEINRKYIKLRYQLIPYLYDLMFEAEKSGLPVIRPLLLQYQNDEKTYEINDQFMFGENILVAPVLQQGQLARAVYLPEGKWTDYWTKETVEGGSYILRDTPLDLCPIYVKAGSIIPNYPEQNYIGEKKITDLLLDVYVGDGSYLHYQDNGENFEYQNGEYNLYQFSMKVENGITVNIEALHEGYHKKYDTFTLKINQCRAEEVKVDGQAVPFNNLAEDIVVTIDAKSSTIEIK